MTLPWLRACKHQTKPLSRYLINVLFLSLWAVNQPSSDILPLFRNTLRSLQMELGSTVKEMRGSKLKEGVSAVNTASTSIDPPSRKGAPSNDKRISDFIRSHPNATLFFVDFVL